jgi:hypothetical protein
MRKPVPKWYTAIHMNEPSSSARLQPDVHELILCEDPQYTCETYIFEPSPAEQPLGQLVAVAETESRDGIGHELLDLALTAMQREYYRNSKRGVISSFESALHQANLVLHDASEQGVRDWMGFFNVAVGVLAGNNLHISVAGEACVLLCRHQRLTSVSYGLSHLPITNPLRTFSQVASGVISARDILFFGTAAFNDLFQATDLTRLSVDHSASTIGLRLQQLYSDQRSQLPVAALTISILPQHIAEPRRESGGPARRPVTASAFSPLPRQPLVLHSSRLRALLALTFSLTIQLSRWVGAHLWSLFQLGSRHSRTALATASRATSRSVQTLAHTSLSTGPAVIQPVGLARRMLAFVKNLPRSVLTSIRYLFTAAPLSSRIFAGLTVVLAIAFVVSLLLLRNKRVEDAEIQRASELLHSARTKQEAVANALIYDNRDQARQLLTEAEGLQSQLQTTGLYTNETAELTRTLQAHRDRLQKIVRVDGQTTTPFSDLSSLLTGKDPTQLFSVGDTLLTYDPDSNVIIAIDGDGQPRVVHDKTQGVGFFAMGTAHEADKTILFITKEPDVALFDTKSNTLTEQAISFPAAQSEITAVATYGTRLYLYDRPTNNIYGYSKTLRGYSSGGPWLKDNSGVTTIRSMAIDGAVYALHEGGLVTKFFKGERDELTLEPIEPSLQQASKIYTTDSLTYLYIVDPAQKRVAIYTKEGALQRQVYIDGATNVMDIAISNDETKLFALDGKRIVSISLAE